MSGKASRSFPLANLEAQMRGDDGPMRQESATADWEPNRVLPSYIAYICDVSLTTVHRWHKDGIPLPAADRAASKLNLPPSLIWPDFYADLDVDSIAEIGPTEMRAAA